MKYVLGGKRNEISISLLDKNCQGQTNPPLIKIILQTANIECVYTVKYTVMYFDTRAIRID